MPSRTCLDAVYAPSVWKPWYKTLEATFANAGCARYFTMDIAERIESCQAANGSDGTNAGPRILDASSHAQSKRPCSLSTTKVARVQG